MVHFIISLFNTILTILKIAQLGFKKTCIIPSMSNREINVIVNGPSSESIMKLLGTDEIFTNKPSMVVNFFAYNKEYEILKPEYYCFADPIFFMDIDNRSKKVKGLFENINVKTKWPLTIFIPYKYGSRKFLEYSKLNNRNINIIEISTIGYKGFEQFRYWSYKKGYCAPEPYTVAIMALYTCIQYGFKFTNIYGLDNNYYKSLELDYDCNVCDRLQHNGEPDEIRKIKNVDGSRMSLCDYLTGICLHLRNHEYVEKYARYRNSIIVNHSAITMVDAYRRKCDK